MIGGRKREMTMENEFDCSEKYFAACQDIKNTIDQYITKHGYEDDGDLESRIMTEAVNGVVRFSPSREELDCHVWEMASLMPIYTMGESSPFHKNSPVVEYITSMVFAAASETERDAIKWVLDNVGEEAARRLEKYLGAYFFD